MVKKKFYIWDEFDADINLAVKWIKTQPVEGIYGIPKGGLVIATAIANHLSNLKYIHNVKDINEKTLIVDDISDSGETLLKIPNKNLTLTLFCKEKTKYQPTKFFNIVKEDEWLVFPWEPKEKANIRDGTKYD